VRIANDGLVYVCDRHTNDRIQVFQKNGTFVKEFPRPAETRARDRPTISPPGGPEPKPILVIADGPMAKRSSCGAATGKRSAPFGHYGKQVGQFHNIHQIVSDSKGNIYTGEVDLSACGCRNSRPTDRRRSKSPSARFASTSPASQGRKRKTRVSASTRSRCLRLRPPPQGGGKTGLSLGSWSR